MVKFQTGDLKLNLMAKLNQWQAKSTHYFSDALIPIPVSVLVLFLAVSVCIGKAKNARY